MRKNKENVECIYAFYGLNRLRCSHEAHTGQYCTYWKCPYFKKDKIM